MCGAAHFVVGGMMFRIVEHWYQSRDYRSLVSKIISYGIAFCCAFLSHFAVDHIPHYDYNFRVPNYAFGFLKLGCDLGIGLLLLSMIAGLISVKNSLRYTCIFVSGFLGLLPDILIFFYRHSHVVWFKKFVIFHDACHATVRPGLGPGMFSQIFLIVGALLLCQILKK